MPYFLVKAHLNGADRVFRCESIGDVEALQDIFAKIGIDAVVVDSEPKANTEREGPVKLPVRTEYVRGNDSYIMVGADHETVAELHSIAKNEIEYLVNRINRP